MSIEEKLSQSIQFIQSKYQNKPEIGVVLGSGYGEFCEKILHVTAIDYAKIPHFPVSTVMGHKGQLLLGKIKDKNVVVMAGRLHYYEGYSLQDIVFPIRVMKKLGVKTLIVTNAAGGINKAFKVGDLMLIRDHINMIGCSPLRGPNLDSLGPRFSDMTHTYTPSLLEVAVQVAKECSIGIHKGVYLATHGPNFETPAEIHMMRVLGADVVGMSTVPEVIAARHMGLDILGVSCVSNMAAGILSQQLSHDDVFNVVSKIKPKIIQLLEGFIEKVGGQGGT